MSESNVDEPSLLLYTNAFALFSAESSRGLFISSLFSYIASSAAENDPRDWVGYAVSAFSLGRLASSFALPLLLECGFSYSAILVFTNVLQIGGHVMYVLPSVLQRGDLSVTIIIAARALVGFGSGSLPTCRAVVAQVTTTQRRAFHFSVLSFFKYVGYALVPGLSIAIAKVDFKLSHSVRLSNTTMPAFLSVLLSLTSLILIILFFDHGLKGARGGADSRKNAPTPASTPPQHRLEREESSPLMLTTTVQPAELRVSSSSLNAGGVGAQSPLRDSSTSPTSDAAASSRCRVVRELFCGKPLDYPPATRLLFRALQLFVVLNLVTKASLAVAETTIAVQFSQAIASSVPSSDLAFDTAAYVFALGVFGLSAYLFMALRPPPLTSSEIRSGARFSCFRRHALTIEKALLLVMLVLTGVGSLACIPISSLSRNLVLGDLTFGMILVWSIAGPILDILTVSSYSVLVSEVGSGGSQARDMAAISAAGSIGRISLPSLLGSISLTGTWLLSAVLSFVVALMTAHFYFTLPSFLGKIHGRRHGENEFHSSRKDAPLLSASDRYSGSAGSLVSLALELNDGGASKAGLHLISVEK